ncbi:MarR family winged helix-turn-helix transcriptional regulator [Azospirillum doebereinerae]
MAERVEVSDLTSHLGYWLRYVSNHVSHAFARKLAGHGVTVAEWAVLRELYDVQTIAPNRVADRMGMTRGAISKLADRLAGKRLVERQADATDGRAQTLALTPHGRGIVPKLAALADENDAEFFAHLAPEDRERIGHVLRDIVERRGLAAIPVD